MSKVKFVCATCGSADVRLDAWAEWNVEAQAWQLAQTFDAAHCEACEGECRVEEIEVEAANYAETYNLIEAPAATGPFKRDAE